MKTYKKILLLKVPYCQFPGPINKPDNFQIKQYFRPEPSLALAVLAAFVDKYKSYDYRLSVTDVNIEAYSDPKKSIDISVYTDLLHDCVKDKEYDVLAISSTFVFNYRWVDMTVKLSKKFHPEAKIVLGGAYATIFPERCLREHKIDDVVIGEGEATLLHILNRYNNHSDREFESRFPFDGHASRSEKGEIYIRPKETFLNLDSLPIPAWHYYDIEKYFKNSGRRALSIEGGRGCPYNCTYCSTYLWWGRKVRYKTVENVIKEIKAIKKSHDHDCSSFVDDNLSFSKPWFTEFLKKFIEINLPVKISVINFSVKHLDEEVISLMARAGIRLISMAVESGSLEIQKRINKNIDFKKLKETVELIKTKGVSVHLCWMLGFPGETLEQINNTFRLARELKAHSNQFMTVLPYPGTKMFREAKDAGLLMFQEDDLDKFDTRSCDYLKSNEWNYDLLRNMIYDANIELNFLSSPLFDNQEGEAFMLEKMENLVLALPEHVISYIVAGYLYKKNKRDKFKEYYLRASKLLKVKSLSDVFSKYLSWNHPIIKDFNSYIAKN